MHSKHFSKVKSFFDNGLWSKAKVADAVVKNWITAAEYAEITGEQYNA